MTKKGKVKGKSKVVKRNCFQNIPSYSIWKPNVTNKDVELKISRISNEIQKLMTRKMELIANGAIGFFAEYVLSEFGFGKSKSKEFNPVIKEMWEVKIKLIVIGNLNSKSVLNFYIRT